jgi:basic membrane protein A
VEPSRPGGGDDGRRAAVAPRIAERHYLDVTVEHTLEVETTKEGTMRPLRLLALVAMFPLIVPAVGTAGAATSARVSVTKVGVAYDVAGLGDLGYNDMARQGALRAAAEHPIRLIEMQQATGGRLSDPAVVLTRLAKRADLVVAAGFAYHPPSGAVAAAHPDTNFVILDGVPGVDPIPSNLLGTSVAQNEGSFLVGAAAAHESTTGQIGFIGGVDLPVIFEFQAGFAAGVVYHDPSATVAADYLSSFPDFSGFNDAPRAHDRAMEMYASGIDVIFHAAGGSGIGVFEAARDYSQANSTRVWAIGVDTDQYLLVPDDLKPFILTSMVKRIDVVAHDVIASQVAGTFTGGIQVWDLSRNGVDYARSGGFIDDFVPTLESIKQGIIGGLIDVPTTI